MILLAMFWDLPAWILAMVFVALGLLWWPGYLIGIAVIVVVALRVFLTGNRRHTYYCPLCRESFIADGVARSWKRDAA